MKKYRCQKCGGYGYSAADQRICPICDGQLKEETMSNIIKASDVLGDNHDADEINQVQDNTETEKNQIPDEILRELATMQKRFRELYSEYNLCGISDSLGVHITDQAFLDTFTDFETFDFKRLGYTEQLETTAYGVKFFCIR